MPFHVQIMTGWWRYAGPVGHSSVWTANTMVGTCKRAYHVIIIIIVLITERMRFSGLSEIWIRGYQNATGLHCIVCVCFQWFNAPLTRTTRKGGWRKGIYVAVGFSDGKLNYHLVLFRVQNVNSINLDNVQHIVPPTTVSHIKVNQCVW